MTELDFEIDIYKEFFYVDLCDENDKFLMKCTELFTVPKFYKWQSPTIDVKAAQDDDNFTFEIKSDCFVKSVEIDFNNHDIILSDNYFDITTKDSYVVSFKRNVAVEELIKDMKIRTVFDIN